mgnify:CR=1 FL=1
MSDAKLPADLFGFLKDLSTNNNREWFNANKARYKAVKAEFEGFIETLIPIAQGIDPLEAEARLASLSDAEVIELADAVGSTTQLIKAAHQLPNETLIVATDKGIFYKMQQGIPDKKLIPAPTGGAGGTCRMCAHCPWMAMNGLHNLELRVKRRFTYQRP